MSEQAPSQEAVLQERFSRFVSEHAAQAVLWFVVSRGRHQPDTYLDHIEFETDRYNRNGAAINLEGHEDRFSMDLYTTTSLLDEDPVVVKRGVNGSGIKIVDSKFEELGIITDIPRSTYLLNPVGVINGLLDHLVELEESGFLIPPHRRSYGL